MAAVTTDAGREWAKEAYDPPGERGIRGAQYLTGCHRLLVNGSLRTTRAYLLAPTIPNGKIPQVEVIADPVRLRQLDLAALN